MITVEAIRKQMEYMGMSSYCLSKLSGVGYSTINGLTNKERKIENLRADNYERITRSLFTKTEIMLIEESILLQTKYENEFKKMIEYALNQDDVKIYRSGAVAYNTKNEPENKPVHVSIEWSIFNLNIYDVELYNQMNNKGQRDKRELIRGYIK